MREWLSGRALPCQGRYRGSESRLPLQMWHHRQVVRLGSAKPLSPVRIWVVPPKMPKWRNGRRKGFKIPRGQPCAGSSPAFGTKKVVSIGYDFFYPNRRFGISSPHEVWWISSALWAVYHHGIAVHTLSCGLMRYNTAC